MKLMKVLSVIYTIVTTITLFMVITGGSFEATAKGKVYYTQCTSGVSVVK